MTGLRERNKAMRVEAILDASAELLADLALDEITTDAIAARAGVSPATVYNLVGTRHRLMAALLGRVIDDLFATVAEATARDDDPIAVAHLIVDHSVAAFTRHPRAYRRIVAAGRADDSEPMDDRRDPSELQAAALRRAQQLGIIQPDLDPAGLGRQVYVSWIGAMEHWAGGRLDDNGFGVATRHGLLTVLTAAATDQHRGRFLAELGAASVELDHCWTS